RRSHGHVRRRRVRRGFVRSSLRVLLLHPSLRRRVRGLCPNIGAFHGLFWRLRGHVRARVVAFFVHRSLLRPRPRGTPRRCTRIQRRKCPLLLEAPLRGLLPTCRPRLHHYVRDALALGHGRPTSDSRVWPVLRQHVHEQRRPAPR